MTSFSCHNPTTLYGLYLIKPVDDASLIYDHIRRNVDTNAKTRTDRVVSLSRTKRSQWTIRFTGTRKIISTLLSIIIIIIDDSITPIVVRTTRQRFASIIYLRRETRYPSFRGRRRARHEINGRVLAMKFRTIRLYNIIYHNNTTVYCDCTECNFRKPF